MPRVFQRAVQNYAPGTYGGFSIDGFTRDDTSALKFSITVEDVADWPGVAPLITGSLLWDTGAGMPINLPGTAPIRGDPLVRYVQVDVPRSADAGGKVVVANGTLTLTLHAPFRCALKVEALEA